MFEHRESDIEETKFSYTFLCVKYMTRVKKILRRLSFCCPLGEIFEQGKSDVVKAMF